MKVTIITDALEKKGYRKGESYGLTPTLGSLFIKRGWAKEYEEKKGKKGVKPAPYLPNKNSSGYGTRQLGAGESTSPTR